MNIILLVSVIIILSLIVLSLIWSTFNNNNKTNEHFYDSSTSSLLYQTSKDGLLIGPWTISANEIKDGQTNGVLFSSSLGNNSAFAYGSTHDWIINSGSKKGNVVMQYNGTDNSGKVGIGTNSPSDKLTVNGGDMGILNSNNLKFYESGTLDINPITINKQNAGLMINQPGNSNFTLKINEKQALNVNNQGMLVDNLESQNNVVSPSVDSNKVRTNQLCIGKTCIDENIFLKLYKLAYNNDSICLGDTDDTCLKAQQINALNGNEAVYLAVNNGQGKRRVKLNGNNLDIDTSVDETTKNQSSSFYFDLKHN